MKRYFERLGIFAFLLLGFHSLYAQDLEISIVNADTILTPGGKCTIELKVSGGKSPYTYMLFDNEPWDGGKLLEKFASTNELTHSFTILSAGRYLAAVRDDNELTKIIIIQIKLAETGSMKRVLKHNAKYYRI